MKGVNGTKSAGIAGGAVSVDLAGETIADTLPRLRRIE
jgi:hypothetical protein